VIKVRNLRKIYSGAVPTVAIDGVSFDIQEGEFVAIMGPSGSGKSTLMHILGFLDKPTSGSYQFWNREISEFSEQEMAKIRNKKIGFVFQMFNLLPRLNILENIELPLLYSGITKLKRNELVMRAIEEISLSHRLSHFPNQLSGGEQQRVAIARALVNDPAVIFADEPTGNLDSESGQRILDIFQNLNQKGRTIILVTHEEQIAKRARRILYLVDGKLIKDELK